MSSYLQTLAKLFASSVPPQEMSDYAFVFPNRRAGIFFRRHLAQAFSHPIRSPHILTINECFYHLSDLRIADPIDLLLRVYDAYCHTNGSEQNAESLDTFLYWGKMMLSDFSEIDNHLIDNVKELFTTIQDLKQVDAEFDYLTPQQREAISKFWSEIYATEIDHQTIKQRFIHQWQRLYPTYLRLREDLKKDGLAYDGMLHRELIEHWDEINPDRLHKRYVFIGFNALTRSEEKLMTLLQKQGIADFYFDYQSAMLRDPNNRASLFLQHNQSTFRSQYRLPESAEDNQPTIQLINVSSTISEAHEVYRILKQLSLPAEQLTRTVVVLPDERMLLPILSAIPPDIHKVNVTMGYPIAATPIFALLKLLATLRQNHTKAGYYHKDVLPVLNHRYIQQIEPELCQTWITRIQEENLIYVQPESSIFDIQTPTFTYIRNILARIPDTQSEDIYLVQTAINRIEQTMGKYTQVFGQVSEKTLFELINLLIGEQTIPYVGEPLQGLQVMGVLETRALDFDTIIITSFNDDTYPGNSHSNSYIPYVLRKGFGLPTPERQDAIFAYNFYRMLSYAKQVYLITNSRADDQHSGEPSRYLAQLKYQYNLPIQVIVNQSQPAKSKSSAMPSAIAKNKAILDKLSQYIDSENPRSLSPSAINSYLRCQMLFYWRNVVEIHEPKQINEELQDNELGTILHGVLENLYRPFIEQDVTCEDMEKMKAHINEWIPIVAEKEGLKYSELTRNVINEYAQIILKKDQSIAPIHYLASEKSIQMPLTLTDGRRVLLKGKADRIDRHGLTSRLVDYKSGKAMLEFTQLADLFDTTNSEKNNSYALQTILYSLMSGIKDIEPHIYSVRQLNNNAETAIHIKGQCDLSIEAIREEFLEGLRQLIAAILSPDTPFMPANDPRNCEKCSMRALCYR